MHHWYRPIPVSPNARVMIAVLSSTAVFPSSSTAYPLGPPSSESGPPIPSSSSSSSSNSLSLSLLSQWEVAWSRKPSWTTSEEEGRSV